MTSSRESHFTPGETEAQDFTEHLPEVRVQPRFASSINIHCWVLLCVDARDSVLVGTFFLPETGRRFLSP